MLLSLSRWCVRWLLSVPDVRDPHHLHHTLVLCFCFLTDLRLCSPLVSCRFHAGEKGTFLQPVCERRLRCFWVVVLTTSDSGAAVTVAVDSRAPRLTRAPLQACEAPTDEAELG